MDQNPKAVATEGDGIRHPLFLLSQRGGPIVVWKFGKVSPMLILSTTLIVGFGALTIWLRDERFIQFKPTAIYLLFGGVLIVGWLRGRAWLQVLLEAAFEGVTQKGWLKLHGAPVSNLFRMLP